MCEFLSWIEKGDKVYFLTGKQVYDTPKGKALKEWSQNIEDDKTGHGAIRFYYNIVGGEDKECSDFSTPDNFPPVIAKAIKVEKMRRMGISKQLLTQQAWAEYKKIEQPAGAEYDKIRQQAWAEYDKIRQQALAEYNKIRQQAFWDFFAVIENRNPAWR